MLKQICYIFLLFLSSGFAQSQVQTLPEGAFAVVNGRPLSDALLNLSAQANVSRDQPDTPQLRTRLKSDLIGQEVFAQEAKRLKLDQTPQARTNFELMQQSYLTNLLLDQFRQTHQATSAQLQAEYDEFVKQMQGAKQYRLSIIAVPTEAKAKELIAQLSKSKEVTQFSKIARELSTDPSKELGGQLDWLLPQQMLPSVSNVVANLDKGKLSAVPILTQGGWNVVRVDDIRPYKVPALKDIESQLQQAALQRALATYLQSLQQKAEVIR